MGDMVPGSAVWAWLPADASVKDVLCWLPAVVTDSQQGASSVRVKVLGTSPAAGSEVDVPVERTFLQNQDGDVNGAEVSSSTSGPARKLFNTTLRAWCALYKAMLSFSYLAACRT